MMTTIGIDDPSYRQESETQKAIRVQSVQIMRLS